MSVGLAVDESTKDSVGSDNYSGGSGQLNEDSNMSFPGDETSQDTDMKAGRYTDQQKFSIILLNKSLAC